MAKLWMNTGNRSETIEFDESYADVLAGVAKAKPWIELHREGSIVSVNPANVVMMFGDAIVPEPAPSDATTD